MFDLRTAQLPRSSRLVDGCLSMLRIPSQHWPLNNREHYDFPLLLYYSSVFPVIQSIIIYYHLLSSILSSIIYHLSSIIYIIIDIHFDLGLFPSSFIPRLYEEMRTCSWPGPQMSGTDERCSKNLISSGISPPFIGV